VAENSGSKIYIDPSPYTAAVHTYAPNPNDSFIYKLFMTESLREQAARLTIAPIRHMMNMTLETKPIMIRSRNELFPVIESLKFLADGNGPCVCTHLTTKEEKEIRDVLAGKLTIIAITESSGTASFQTNWFKVAQEIAVAYETEKLTNQTATLLPDPKTLAKIKACYKEYELNPAATVERPIKFVRRPHNLANLFENRFPLFLTTNKLRPEAVIPVPNNDDSSKASEPAEIPVAKPKIEHSLNQTSNFLQTVHLQIVESHLLLLMKNYMVNNIQSVVPEHLQDSTYVAIERPALDSLFAQGKRQDKVNSLLLRTYKSLGTTLLIDSHMRIRWRACGPLCEDDVVALRSVIPSLIHEYRLEKYGEELEKLKNEKKKRTFSDAPGYAGKTKIKSG